MAAWRSWTSFSLPPEMVGGAGRSPSICTSAGLPWELLSLAKIFLHERAAGGGQDAAGPAPPLLPPLSSPCLFALMGVDRSAAAGPSLSPAWWWTARDDHVKWCRCSAEWCGGERRRRGSGSWPSMGKASWRWHLLHCLCTEPVSNMMRLFCKF
jgi:hypothetical protein